MYDMWQICHFKKIIRYTKEEIYRKFLLHIQLHYCNAIVFDDKQVESI